MRAANLRDELRYCSRSGSRSVHHDISTGLEACVDIALEVVKLVHALVLKGQTLER